MLLKFIYPSKTATKVHNCTQVISEIIFNELATEFYISTVISLDLAVFKEPNISYDLA